MKQIMIVIPLSHDIDHIHLPLLKEALKTPKPRQYRLSEWVATLSSAHMTIDQIERELGAHGVHIAIEAHKVSLLAHILPQAAKRLRAGEARKAFVTSMAYFKGLIDADPDYKVLQARNQAEEEAAERVTNLKKRLAAAEDNLRQLQQQNRVTEKE